MKKVKVWSIVSIVLMLCLGCAFYIFNDINSENKIEEVSFSELLDENYNVTKKLIKLDGRKVSITGYMSFTSGENGQARYICNAPLKKSADWEETNNTIINSIKVISLKEGNTIPFSDGLITVTGTLRLTDDIDEFGYFIPFIMEASKIEPVSEDGLRENLREYLNLTSYGYIYSSYMILDDMVNYTDHHDHEDATEEEDENFEIIDITSLKSTIGILDSMDKESYRDIKNILEEALVVINDINLYIEEDKVKDLGIFNERATTIMEKYNKWIEKMAKIN